MALDKSHLLLVEDDEVTRETLRAYLLREGYRVHVAANGEQMRQQLERTPEMALILLDINLPDSDGLTLMSDLRRASDIPVILVTARNDDIDRILGLEMGADDYICKPFNDRELLARIKSVLRRSLQRGVEEPQATRIHQFDGWRLDTLKRSLVNPNNEEVSLTTAEFDMLHTFVLNKGRVLNRNQLLEAVSNRSWNPNDRTVDVMVGRLRRKLEDDPAKPRLLVTIRSIGYQFVPRGE